MDKDKMKADIFFTETGVYEAAQAKLYRKTMDSFAKYKHRAAQYTICVLGYSTRDMYWEDYMDGIQLIHKKIGMLVHIRAVVYFTGGNVEVQLLGPIGGLIV